MCMAKRECENVIIPFYIISEPQSHTGSTHTFCSACAKSSGLKGSMGTLALCLFISRALQPHAWSPVEPWMVYHGIVSIKGGSPCPFSDHLTFFSPEHNGWDRVGGWLLQPHDWDLGAGALGVWWVGWRHREDFHKSDSACHWTPERLSTVSLMGISAACLS